MSTLTPIPPARPAILAAEQPAPRAGQALPGALPAAPVTPNPSLRLDPALGLVVLEFRDQHGRTTTLPTERELKAYRNGGSPGEPRATAQAVQAEDAIGVPRAAVPGQAAPHGDAPHHRGRPGVAARQG